MENLPKRLLEIYSEQSLVLVITFLDKRNVAEIM